MHEYPRVREGQKIIVEFAAITGQSETKSLEMVLDFGELGDVKGIEIIGLKFALGKSCLRTITETTPGNRAGIAYCYDESCDCFSLRLKDGHSWNQKAVYGEAVLEKGAIVAMSAAWDS
jgi:hypothetical protein